MVGWVRGVMVGCKDVYNQEREKQNCITSTFLPGAATRYSPRFVSSGKSRSSHVRLRINTLTLVICGTCRANILQTFGQFSRRSMIAIFVILKHISSLSLSS
jgi:hypothetical protein